MQTENVKTSHTDEVAKDEFATKLLEQLLFIEPKRLLEVRAFFSQAFLLHTQDEVFNETNYRSEWATNVNYINELCCCVDKYSEEQLDTAIAHSIKILKKEKEVRRA